MTKRTQDSIESLAGHTVAANDEMTTATPDWLTQLRAWETSGTLDRIWAARDSREEVTIKRSSGAMQAATVESQGFGGRSVSVRFEIDEGERYKSVRTEDFLVWNPAFDLTGGASHS